MDTRLKMTPVVAIVGRPNVGKSTLFNKLLERRKALTSPEAGTTRDLNYGHFHWRTLTMTAIDTAGLDLTAKAATEEDLKRQARAAIAKADIIIFVADVTEGMLPQDKALAKELQKTKKTVLLAANKADNPRKRALAETPDWLKLGFGAPTPVSAASGSGIGDLLDLVVDDLKARGLESKPLPPIDARVAIIGRPNVGKSTLLNTLAGEERVLVSEIPHTTKEPQDTLLIYEDEKLGQKNILLVDTVGIRKRAHVGPGMEKIGVSLSLEELEAADVALLMIDATQGAGLQEKKLAGVIEDKTPAMVVLVNKWDLAEERKLGDADDYRKYIQRELPFIAWAPILFMSALTGNRTNRILHAALTASIERDREVDAPALDAFAERLKKVHHSTFARGAKLPKVYGLTQVSTRPPTFMLVVKDKETLHPNFVRFVEKLLRQEFGFEGTPIRVLARQISK